MKEGCKYEKLGDIFHILNGFAFKSTKYVPEGIRVIRITNVQKGSVVDSSPKFYPIEELPLLTNYMLEDGDLLMSLTGNVGRVCISGQCKGRRSGHCQYQSDCGYGGIYFSGSSG